MGKPSWRMRYLIYGLFAGGILFIISPSHSPFKDHVSLYTDLFFSSCSTSF